MMDVEDHVGELEIGAEAATPGQVIDRMLAALAAEALDPPPSRAGERVPVAIDAAGWGELLVDLLNEAIFLLDARSFVATGLVASELSERGVRGALVGVTDPDARPIAKAATHHRLRFERSGARWSANVVIDV